MYCVYFWWLVRGSFPLCYFFFLWFCRVRGAFFTFCVSFFEIRILFRFFYALYCWAGREFGCLSGCCASGLFSVGVGVVSRICITAFVVLSYDADFR